MIPTVSDWRAGFGKHFIGWQHPIQGNGVTISGRTNNAQRTGAAVAANHLDFVAGNNPGAGKAITLFIERSPFSELIETLQNLELLLVGNFVWREKHRSPRITVNGSENNQADAEFEGRTKPYASVTLASVVDVLIP
jgi:hypothetical protein